MTEIWLPPQSPETPPSEPEPLLDTRTYRLTEGFLSGCEYVVVASARSVELEVGSEPCYVNFSVYETAVDCEWSPDESGEEWFTGHIKWDGCSNWELPDHFCRIPQVQNLSRVMTRLYGIAAQWMPSNDFDDELRESSRYES
jgi:hypothetical protein